MISIGPTFFFSQPHKEFEREFNCNCHDIKKLMINNTQTDLDGLARLLRSPTHTAIPKTIVYVQTKDMAWKVYHFLQQAALKWCYVGMYHANLTSHTKSVVHRDFGGPSS